MTSELLDEGIVVDGIIIEMFLSCVGKCVNYGMKLFCLVWVNCWENSCELWFVVWLGSLIVVNCELAIWWYYWLWMIHEMWRIGVIIIWWMNGFGRSDLLEFVRWQMNKFVYANCRLVEWVNNCGMNNCGASNLWRLNVGCSLLLEWVICDDVSCGLSELCYGSR